mgnify:CR=1 FL=1
MSLPDAELLVRVAAEMVRRGLRVYDVGREAQVRVFCLHRPLQPNVYLLQQMSTGRYLADNGRLVLVDADGRRLQAAPPVQPE